MYYENPIYNGKELLKIKKPETLAKRYLGILSPTAIDFMKGLLELDPSKRLSGENVFKHKYFSIFMKNNNENNNNINANSNNINNANSNMNNSNSITNIKDIKDIKIKDEKSNVINKVNNNININKINIKNINPNVILSNNQSKRNDNSQNKVNAIKKTLSINKDKEKKEDNSKKSEKDRIQEENNTNRENNNSISINNINPKISNKSKEREKRKKDIESKPINITPSKVINNTTNINIINYNCYNNATNRNSNLQLQKKILDITQNQKSQFKSFTTHDLLENNLINISKPKEVIINHINNNNKNITLFNGSESFYGNKNNFTLKKKLNNFTKSMMNFNSIKINKLTLVNKPSKKSTSVKIIDNDNNNASIIDLSQKMPQSIGALSLSQGKLDKKKKDKNIIKQANNTFYNFNLNVIQNNNNNTNSIMNSGNHGNTYKGSNTSNNFASLLSKAYSTNGFKSFYTNKDNKYNYKLNTNYIKEENKKYLYNNNSFNDKNIIDEKDEFEISENNIYDYNQKSYSKKKAKKKLLIPYGSENLDIYNKNSMGYGTFYNKNFMFGYKKKDKAKKNINNNKLPKLYNSISNATQYNYFVNNKIKKNNSNIYMIGKNAFNPYNYDYTSKLKYFNP